MLGTFGVAPGISVAEEVRRARASGLVVSRLTKRVLAANSFSADWDTLEALALFALRAVSG